MMLYHIIFILLLFAPNVAFANVVWPALVISQSFVTIPVIVFGVIVELLAVRLLFNPTYIRCTVSVLLANVCSAVAGGIVTFIVTLNFSVIASMLPGNQDGWPPQPIWYIEYVYWSLLWGVTTYVNTVIEGTIYIKFFKFDLELTYTSKRAWILFCANGVSGGLALILFYWKLGAT